MAQTFRSESNQFPVTFCLLAIFILCAATFFVGLNSLSMIGPDEPRYSQVAREMDETGDWITPNLAGIHWFEKPALTYWLIAASYKIFGVSEFSARFPIAVFSLLGVALLYFFGREIRSSRFGYLSATVLASSGLWVAFSRAATFDLPLSIAIEIAMLAFYLWYRDDKNLFWYLSCFGMGLAVLAKGLVGIVLPGAIIAAFLLLTRSLPRLLKQPFLILIGAMIFLITTATWYGPMFVRHGNEFFQEFFVAHHFQRFLTNKYHHPQPFYFFLIVAISGCFPWSLFFLNQIFSTLKNWRETITKDEARLQLCLWIWILIIIGFFSISTSKLTGYILPVFPAIALLIGDKLDQWWENKPRTIWRWFCLLTIAVFLCAGIFLMSRLDHVPYVNEIKVLALALVIFIGVFVTVSLLFVKGEKATVLALPFLLASIIVTINFTVTNYFETIESTAEMVSKATAQMRPGERLVFFINNHHSIDFYAPALPLRDDHSELLTLMKPEEIAAQLSSQPSGSLLVMTPTRWLEGLEIMKTEQLDRYYSWTLVRVTSRNQLPQ